MSAGLGLTSYDVRIRVIRVAGAKLEWVLRYAGWGELWGAHACMLG